MSSSTPAPRGGTTLLVTQALPYANGDIHLGHLVEAVQSDLFVRFHRLRGDKALFVCADDTHGTPIELTALKKGLTPQQLIDSVWQSHVKDYAAFDIGFDTFYTTNSEENRYFAEYIYGKLRQEGLVAEREVTQYYCEHDRRFLPDRFVVGVCPRCGAAEQYGDVCEACGSTYDPTDLKTPHCIICRNVPVLKKSTHLFVQLAKCEDFLREFVCTRDVLRDDMKNFVARWIDEGLKEWCISRDGPYFGFAIPDLPGKFFYVWLDAPIGYIAATRKWCDDHGEDVMAYWGAGADARVVHFIGKDIVYFHALFWPVMLQNAKLNLPSKIFVHGFLSVAGEKMSKTRGTFLLAREYIEKVKHPQAAEFLRFYFASKLANNAEDIDLNADELVSRVNTILANNIGNLHHRTVVFCEKFFDGKVPDAPWDEAIAAEVAAAAAQIAAAYEQVEYKTAIERMQTIGNLGNKFYQDSKPWETVKTDRAAAAATMVTCANIVKALGVFLKPVVPGIVAALERQLGMTFAWDDWKFSLRNHPLGTTVKLVAPLEASHLAELFAGVTRPAPAAESQAPQVDIAAFQALDFRVAAITKAERVKKSSKLVKLEISLGSSVRQIVAGIGQHYTPEELVGRQIVVIANLKPAVLMGEKSEGMLLAAHDGERLVLVAPEKQAGPGSRIS